MTPVIDHIARRLSVTTDEAGILLQQWVSQLLADLETSGEVTVPGLGTFTREADEIEFVPEPRLASVVNHRFAGLYPLPVDAGENVTLGLDSPYGIPDVPMAADLLTNVGEAAPEGLPDLDTGEARADVESNVDPTDLGDQLEEDRSQDRPFYDPRDEVDVSPEPDEIVGAAGSRPWADTGDLVDSVRDELEGDFPQEVHDTGQVDDRYDQDDIAEPYHDESKTPHDRDDAEGRHADDIVEPSDDIQTESSADKIPWNRPARYPEPDVRVDDEYDDNVGGAEGEAENHDFGDSLIHPASLAAGVTGIDQKDDTASLGSDPEPDPDPEPEPESEDQAAEDDEESVEDPSSTPPIVVRRSTGARAYWLAIPLLIAAIAVVLWLLTQTERTPDAPEQTTGEASEGAAQEAAPPPQPEVAEAQVEPWSPGTVDRRAGGYTIVASSQASRREAIAFAESLASNLQDESLPIDVFRGTAEGRARYRVGVGQFATIESAALEMERLSSQLPAGVWILRIRRNM
ncbi:MAG: hypothetical protein HKN37_08935 [Rhodothermales bacterium]|nr:hypothetical protein [Rhodothermales bacterium]